MALLDQIASPADVRALPPDRLPELAAELREVVVVESAVRA